MAKVKFKILVEELDRTNPKGPVPWCFKFPKWCDEPPVMMGPV